MGVAGVGRLPDPALRAAHVDGVGIALVHRDRGDAAAHVGQRAAGRAVHLAVRDRRRAERPPDAHLAFLLVRVVVVRSREREAASHRVGRDRARRIRALLEEPGVERVALTDAFLAPSVTAGGPLELGAEALPERPDASSSFFALFARGATRVGGDRKQHGQSHQRRAQRREGGDTSREP